MHSEPRHPRRPDADIQAIVISDADAAAARSGTSSAARIRNAAVALVQAAEAPGFRMPMLPATAAEAMAMASDLNIPMNRLERAVARDPLLAARMLAVASSAAYSGQPARSLTAALQRLGTGAVRDVLYQSVMECHVFRGDAEREVRAQQEHAIGVGRLAKAVCKVVGIDQAQAFVGGLLHDIGHLALMELREHPALVALVESERAVVRDVVHTTLGAHIGKKWHLPDTAIEAIRRHHRFREWEPGAYSQIGHVVAVADSVAWHLGVGRPARPLSENERSRIVELGLDPANLVEVAQLAFASGV